MGLVILAAGYASRAKHGIKNENDNYPGRLKNVSGRDIHALLAAFGKRLSSQRSYTNLLFHYASVMYSIYVQLATVHTNRETTETARKDCPCVSHTVFGRCSSITGRLIYCPTSGSAVKQSLASSFLVELPPDKLAMTI